MRDEFLLNDLTEMARIFDPLSEAFVFGNENLIDVEIVVDDAILRFGETRHDVLEGISCMRLNLQQHFSV